MIIKSVYIKEFGSIKDREIVFGDGLNIIEGDNESGKSTLLSFIKFMLYGLPKKSAGEVVTEKERAFSWSGGVAEGSMTVLCGMGEIRIERSAKASSRTETPRIFNALTGEQIFRGENPGELFFGLPLNVFESTACVRQLKCTQLDGSGLGTSIENLMVAADENMSVKKATARLESIRKKLLHKNGRSGEITELENSVHTLEIRANNAVEKTRHLADRETSLASAERIIAEAREKVREEKEICRAYELKQASVRFEALRSAEERVESLKEQEREALLSGGFGMALPSEEDAARLAESRIKYIHAAENSAKLIKNAEEAESKRAPEDENDVNARRMEDEGGERLILESYSLKCKEASSAVRIGALLTVFALLFAAACCIAFGSGRFIPEIRQFRGDPTVAAAVFAVLAVFCGVFGGLRFAAASRSKRGAAEYAESFGCKEGDREALVIRLAELRLLISERDSFEQMLLRAQKELQDARELEKTALDELCADILRLCPSEDGELDDPAKRADEIVQSCRALSSRVYEIRRDIDKYSALVQERRGELGGLDEGEIRRALTEELEARLEDVDIMLLRRDLEFQQARLEAAESKRLALEREIIALRGSAEDPERLNVKLEETKKLLESRRFALDSLTMAVESIADASEAVRRNITPKLKKRAGEYMNRLTNGKYTELSVSPDFSVSVMADGVTRPIEALSSGTRDAAYLSIRLALVSVLYRTETPTLLLDEILSQIDDTRAQNVLYMLTDYCSSGNQCLLFTCHTRESALQKQVPVIRM